MVIWAKSAKLGRVFGSMTASAREPKTTVMVITAKISSRFFVSIVTIFLKCNFYQSDSCKTASNCLTGLFLFRLTKLKKLQFLYFLLQIPKNFRHIFLFIQIRKNYQNLYDRHDRAIRLRDTGSQIPYYLLAMT